jgi:hypothetical protein
VQCPETERRGNFKKEGMLDSAKCFWKMRQDGGWEKTDRLSKWGVNIDFNERTDAKYDILHNAAYEWLQSYLILFGMVLKILSISELHLGIC